MTARSVPCADVPAASGLTLGEVIRVHGAALVDRWGAGLSGAQRRALDDLAACRTAALGGHVWRCGACGQEQVLYNSCRNRHCPTCQASVRATWLTREASWLLPVEYHHVVFTLPAELAELALANRVVLYNALFQAASATVRELAADPKWLGAQLGVLLVLHTWGQNLHHHPHVHAVVSGGGLSCDAAGTLDPVPHWRSCRPGFFLPVRLLSRVFRGQVLQRLQAAYDRGDLRFPGRLAEQQTPAPWSAFVAALRAKEWVVYAKPPFDASS